MFWCHGMLDQLWRKTRSIVMRSELPTIKTQKKNYCLIKAKETSSNNCFPHFKRLLNHQSELKEQNFSSHKKNKHTSIATENGKLRDLLQSHFPHHIPIRLRSMMPMENFSHQRRKRGWWNTAIKRNFPQSLYRSVIESFVRQTTVRTFVLMYDGCHNYQTKRRTEGRRTILSEP